MKKLTEHLERLAEDGGVVLSVIAFCILGVIRLFKHEEGGF